MTSEAGNPPRKKSKHSTPERSPGIIFTISTPSKLQQSSNSLLSLFDRVLHSEKNESPSEDTSTQNRSVSDAIALELADLPRTSKTYKFSCELSRGMGFVSITRDLNPTDFVHSLLTTHCPSVPPLFVSRILPVELACAPNLQSFHSVVVPAIESKFKGLDRDTTWKIVFDKHGLTNITKDRAIELAQSTIEERHEVSITDPDIVIMIQITHTICGVSFLPDYDQLAEYNIRKLVSRRAQSGSK